MSTIHNPNHYDYGDFDAWDVMIATLGVEKVIDFCEVSAMKYMLRHDKKNGDEDLAKAREMLDKYFELKGDKDEEKDDDPIVGGVFIFDEWLRKYVQVENNIS